MSIVESRAAANVEQGAAVDFAPEGLANGDNLSREEFMRIWEQLPNLKKAELIEGVVYMPSPLKMNHGLSDNRIAYWLTTYSLATPFTQCAGNVTWHMLKSAPQPDQFLRLLPEGGGQSQVKGDYPAGAPELAIEVTDSTASYDLHQKRKLYQEAGVQEYLVVVLRKPEIRWHKLVANEYQLLAPDSGGVMRSGVFPGLWLHGTAFLKSDMIAVMATLQEGLRSAEHAEFVKMLEARKPKDNLLEPPASR